MNGGTIAGATNGGAGGATAGAGGANANAGDVGGSANAGADDTAGAATADGGATSTSGAGAGPAGGAPPSPFDVHAPATPAACNPEVCRVVRETEVMQDGVYSLVDFRLATARDTTYLLLDAYGNSQQAEGQQQQNYLLALGADGEHPIDQGIVPSMIGPLVAVDASGAPHVAGTVAGDGIVAQTWDGTTWARTSVEPSPASGAGLEFEAGPTADPSLFWQDASADYWVSTPRPDGSWQATLLPRDMPSDGLVYRGFALDAQGEPILVDHDLYSYTVADADGNPILPAQFPDELSGAIVEVRPSRGLPQAIPAGDPDLALAVLEAEGLHVVLGTRAGGIVADATIPASALQPDGCPDDRTMARGDPGSSCAAPCPVHTAGLAGGNGLLSTSFALARTSDGASWLAFVTEAIDGEVDYTVSCSQEPPACFCGPSLPSGSISWTLHVVRVTPDGSSNTEALSLPLDPPFDDGFGGEWSVRAGAFDNVVAVAVPVRPNASGTASGVRVLTLEAAQ